VEKLRVKFKFFSTSLLIVTEGCVGKRNCNGRRNRHSSSSEDEDSSLENSIEIELDHALPTGKRSGGIGNGIGRDQAYRNMNYNCSRGEHKKCKSQFDIRMIDFAHTSFSSSSSDGFLVGLESLIKLLNEIIEQERSCGEEEATGEDSDDCHEA